MIDEMYQRFGMQVLSGGYVEEEKNRKNVWGGVLGGGGGGPKWVGGGGGCDGNEISRLSLNKLPSKRTWLVTNHTGPPSASRGGELLLKLSRRPSSNSPTLRLLAGR